MAISNGEPAVEFVTEDSASPPPDPTLISKKELLAQTGISYGQLYRWKRDGLLPEEWFIKRSSFTGQETFLPREQVLSRVKTILDLKDSHSLEQLAALFKPSEEVRYPIDYLLSLPGANKALLAGLEAGPNDDGGQEGESGQRPGLALSFGEAVFVLALGGHVGREGLELATAVDLTRAALPAARLWGGESMGCALIAAGDAHHIIYYQATTPPLLDSGARLIAMLDLPRAAETIRMNSSEFAERG
ncbi:MAG: YhbD family protein [Coriobacteriales bacterium]|jgi:hypothetical protein|nr:YhbD family protein [Coriobacteriales bacterium]